MQIPPGDFAAYLFDLDGTLADTMPLHYRAWRATLDPHGAEYPEELFHRLGGTPTRRIVEILNERQGLAMDPEEIASEKEQRYIASLGEARPIPAVAAAADDARQRGLLVAVVSGGTREPVVRTLLALGMREWFPVIITAEDTARGKPAPDPYLAAAARLGVEPARCLVFEDSETGVAAAAAAGMQCVRV